jgi:transposase
MLAKRHLELTGLRTQAVCRLHAVLTLLRGGMGRRLTAEKASRMLGGIRNLDVIGEHRKAMARSHLADIRRYDRELKANRQLIRTAVTASQTTVTDVYGVGPIVAAFLVGYSGDITRFESAGHYPHTTGQHPSKCHQREAESIGSASAVTGNRTTPSTRPPSPRSDTPTPQAGSTTTRNETKTKPRKKHSEL